MRNPEPTDSVQVIQDGFVQIETKCAHTVMAQAVFELYVALTKKWEGRIEIVWRNLLDDNKIIDYRDWKH